MTTETQNLDTSTPSGDQTPPAETFNDLLGGIKDGDRQKFTSVEDALKSISPSQEHIKKLEEENAQLRVTAEKINSIESMMAKLEEKAKVGDQTSNQQTFDESKLDEVINARLTQREQATVEKNNIDTVTNVFKSKFGDKAVDAYKVAAEQSGLSLEAMKTLIIQSPKAALKLMGVEETKPPSQPSTTQATINAQNMDASSDNKDAKRVPMVGYTSEGLANAWRATKRA